MGRGLVQAGMWLGPQRGLPGSHDLKNLCTTNWPNRTTPKITITLRMGSLRKFRAAACQGKEKKKKENKNRWLIVAGQPPQQGGGGMSQPQALTQPPLCAIHLAM